LVLVFQGTASAVTLAPTLAPTPPVWSGVYCPHAYVAGTAYVGGSIVAVGTLVYQCKTGPASGWCPLPGYTPGTGTAWLEAWTLLGSCSGTIAPTTLSPTTTLPGCPSAWVVGTDYAAGDIVSAGGKRFQCKAHPMTVFCGQAGYEPNIELHGGAYTLAWTTLGYCAGTLAPSTASPSGIPVYTVGGACPATFAAGGAYSAKSRVTSAGTNNVYKCKEYPHSGHCGQAGFEPGTTNGGMGWTLLGTCDPLLTHPPTNAPTAKPTKAPTAKPASPSSGGIGGGGFGLPDLPECNSLMPLPSVLALIPRDFLCGFCYTFIV
jgi:hypothetical protein